MMNKMSDTECKVKSLAEEISDKITSLVKVVYNIGYEDGVQATNVDCGVVWEERIEDIKAEIDNYISDFIATDIVLQIIDKHIGGDKE